MSETGSEQFEVACNFETTPGICFFSAGLTQQHAQRGKGVVDRAVLLCMEIRTGILVNIRFYYEASSYFNSDHEITKSKNNKNLKYKN